jgi:hypothetical protein
MQHLPHMPQLQHLPQRQQLTPSQSQPINTYPAQNITGSIDTTSGLSNILLTECILLVRTAFLKI